jgi:hypothetical protein
MEKDGIPGPEEYLVKLEKLLSRAKTDPEFYQAIVDVPFHDRFQTTVLDLGFLAFLLENKKTNMIDRISISDNEIAKGAIDMTQVEFHEIRVPVNQPGNKVALAISTGRRQETTDWHELTDPAMPAEASRFNQAAAGVSSSIIYPLEKTEPKGAIIYQFYIPMEKITGAHHNFMRHYTKIVSKALKKRKNHS